MIISNIGGITILEAASGKYLTNGDTYTIKVFLGRNADPSDWCEIDTFEEDSDLTAEEALNIIIGGGNDA